MPFREDLALPDFAFNFYLIPLPPACQHALEQADELTSHVVIAVDPVVPDPEARAAVVAIMRVYDAFPGAAVTHIRAGSTEGETESLHRYIYD
jgi:hypothetical protein